jgi:hypothetical protein
MGAGASLNHPPQRSQCYLFDGAMSTPSEPSARRLSFVHTLYDCREEWEKDFLGVSNGIEKVRTEKQSDCPIQQTRRRLFQMNPMKSPPTRYLINRNSRQDSR